MRHLVTMCDVRPDLAQAWAAGRLGDLDLFQTYRPGVPCPALVIMRVDGGPAGMRQLMALLGEKMIAQGIKVQGFAMRTRLPGVERAFARVGGVVTFDEGDGDRRWWCPPGPTLAWLQARARAAAR